MTFKIRMMDGWMTVYPSGRNGISTDPRHKEAWPLQRMNRSPVWVEFEREAEIVKIVPES